MNQDIRISATDKADLIEIIERLEMNAESLETAGVKFYGKAGNSTHSAFGIPEITDLIVAIGAAGGFALVGSILRDYFRNRPNGVLTIKRNGSSETITIKNVNSVALERALVSNLFK